MNEIQTIKISPFDTLFFRDGKPFTMSENSWADGIFPPPPSVIYGALRAAYFSQHPEELKNVNTDEDPTRSLKIIKILYKNKDGLIFPAPLDILNVKKKNIDGPDEIVVFNKFSSGLKDAVTSSPFMPLISDPEKNVENSSGGFVSEFFLMDYFENKIDLNCNPIIEQSSFCSEEPKIGIKRSLQTRTVENGMLYRIGMKRVRDFSIIVSFSGIKPPLSDEGVLKLGGEGKTAYYDNKFSYKEILDIKEEISDFFIYFSTPAVFKKGWIPDGIKEDFTTEIDGKKVTLVNAVIGKPELLGGFNMKSGTKNGKKIEKGPKPMKKAVPAGSIYYFSIENKEKMSVEKITNGFEKKFESEYSDQGYTQFYVGNRKEGE